VPADTRLRNSRLERLMVVFILEGGGYFCCANQAAIASSCSSV
jgi:hypothetical protein